MKSLLDPGHGIETPGKRSPDGKFFEYEYNRIIASRVIAELLDCGYDAQLFVPEFSDITLVEYCYHVNGFCVGLGLSNVDHIYTKPIEYSFRAPTAIRIEALIL